MVLTCLFMAHALRALQIDVVEIPVLHTRPSLIAVELQPLVSTDADSHASLVADDSRGVLFVTGNPTEIKNLRTYVSMFDVARRRVSFGLKVESDVDKESYEVSACILNRQEWNTSDTDTGVSLSIDSRINDDNTVTFFVGYGTKNSRTAHEVIRLRIGEHSLLKTGSHPEKVRTPKSDGSMQEHLATIHDPRISISLLGIRDPF